MISIAPEGGWMFHRQSLFETDQVQVLGRPDSPPPFPSKTRPTPSGGVQQTFFLRWKAAIVLILAHRPWIQGTAYRYDGNPNLGALIRARGNSSTIISAPISQYSWAIAARHVLPLINWAATCPMYWYGIKYGLATIRRAPLRAMQRKLFFWLLQEWLHF